MGNIVEVHLFRKYHEDGGLRVIWRTLKNFGGVKLLGDYEPIHFRVGEALSGYTNLRDIGLTLARKHHATFAETNHDLEEFALMRWGNKVEKLHSSL